MAEKIARLAKSKYGIEAEEIARVDINCGSDSSLGKAVLKDGRVLIV